MEQMQSNMKVAGVDVGKRSLDVAVHGLEDLTRVDNAPGGFNELIGWLKAREVGRVGLEATGGYERGVRAALEAAGLEVVVHQPLEVRLFAKLKRRRAKNDRLDAALIAAATAQVEAVKAAQDPRLTELAERLTAYEQIKLAGQVVAAIKAHPDLLARFRLLISLPGVGPIVAATLVVRMPELGAMRRGQAAALIGVAPFDRDSGQWKGLRFISGGRARPRRMLYLAALQAKRCDPSLKAFADQLLQRGKPAKLAIVAVMRKLIEAANLVLGRGQPWVKQQAT